MDRTGWDDEEQAIRKRRKDAEQRQDRDDYNNEMAGRETGRIHRFFQKERPGSPHDRDRKARREHAALTALMALLADPAYAALYQDTVDMVNDHAAKAEAALEDAEQALATAEARLDELLQNAARLPDGRRVFRDADGTLHAEDGAPIDPVDAEGILWPDDAPSYEDYLAHRRAVADARQKVEDWRDYLVSVIGVARDRLSDEDNPLTADELRELQDRIRDQAPEAVAEPDAPAAHTKDTSFALTLPDL
ncbi:MAG: hypothetical protein QNJ84_02210 [Alphaproteobacteria bacterium]|nr:hypothetical protein [Alphaproteobacteria bacterium]